jgi:hypothetical protein
MSALARFDPFVTPSRNGRYLREPTGVDVKPSLQRWAQGRVAHVGTLNHEASTADRSDDAALVSSTHLEM